MNELQQNRYDRLIRRVGGIIGPGSKVSEVLTELFPMIDVEGDRGELQLLSGTILGMGAGTIVGSVGEVGKIQLFNPVDSGKIVTVTDVLTSGTLNLTMRLARTTIPLASGIGTQLARDTRQIASDFPTAQMFSESSVPFVDANIAFRHLANTTNTLSPKNDVMILAPGNGLSVGPTTTNATLIVTFFWRERVAETSELLT